MKKHITIFTININDTNLLMQKNMHLYTCIWNLNYEKTLQTLVSWAFEETFFVKKMNIYEWMYMKFESVQREISRERERERERERKSC